MNDRPVSSVYDVHYLCGSSHRSPTSRLDKDCGLYHDDLLVPAVRLPTIGRRAFLVTGARTRNDLLVDVTSASPLHTFRK